MDLAIVSDSHVPDRAADIPEPFRERIHAADLTIHAGDFADRDALAMVRDLAADLTAVRGNADPSGLDLPSVALVEAEGVTVVITHGAVNPARRDPTAAADPEGWSEGEGVVADGRDWRDAVVTTARIAAAEGVSDALDRASTPGPVTLDTEAVGAVADAAATVRDPERPVVGIGGHSHRVVDDTSEGVRLLNPGTVTGADPGPRTTMLTLTLRSGEVDVTVHELDE